MGGTPTAGPTAAVLGDLQDTHVSLGFLGATVVLVGLLRVVTRWGFPDRDPRRQPSPLLRTFLLELLATFQLCACTHELTVQADLNPSPHFGISLTYFFTLIHGLTLADSFCNPCAVLEKMAVERLAVGTGISRILAQMAGALLARAYVVSVWSFGLIEQHSADRHRACRNPMRTDVPKACLVEAICSFIFHSAMIQLKYIRPKLRVHLQAALITFLVFAGGSITGAVFNPALALSLHLKCFQGEFHNFAIVYWIGPIAGIATMVLMYRLFLPWLNRKRSLKFE
ncbi:aquaporin-11 isoform X2 [Tachyglossus aculeatus]|uniref:aquaporin-11 isoform X2 n=1 Tax=Tachyglossus aculeatus TaxID=9261 RepID=UPI0018F78E68|nr:aquaporin-11 isoform X2 [Tachyglossus aculeatus]